MPLVRPTRVYGRFCVVSAMSQNVAGFQWTETKEQAAALVARDELTNAEIAATCGITPRTLDRWKAHPAFMTRVTEHHEAYRQAVLEQGIADRVNRVKALNDRWERMQRVIEARSLEYSGVDKEGHPVIAGGETGLLVRQIKSIGIGQNNMTVEEYAVDTGLLKEIRETEKQAAQELGQWADRVDINVALEELVRQIAEETGDSPEVVRPFVSDFVAEKKRRRSA